MKQVRICSKECRRIRKEKNTVAGERLRACLQQKDGCNHRVRPYSTSETGYGACRRAVSAAGTTRNGADENVRYKKVFRAVRRWVKKEPVRFQIRVGLVAAEPVLR